MAQALDKHGSTPRTLIKIILMLGCVLAGVAALAAEPEPAAPDTAAAGASCARSTLEFGGRTTEKDASTDTWILTCERQAAPEAAATATVVRPVPATPVATLPACQANCVPSPAQF